MIIIIKKNYDELSKEAAKIIKEAILEKPNLVLGLATGSTPLGTYQELIQMHKEGILDFSRIITFNLDEYLGLSANHPQSYHYYMKKNLFGEININPENIHIPECSEGWRRTNVLRVPDGTAKDVKALCRDYEKAIQETGGIDLQILGIGSDGHIGFNEPGTSLDSRTHVAKLAESTIRDNSRFFEKKEDVPESAITMGVQTIFEAKKIILLASGENKATAVAKALEGPITSQITASILQRHSNTIVILDEKAASKLKKYG